MTQQTLLQRLKWLTLINRNNNASRPCLAFLIMFCYDRSPFPSSLACRDRLATLLTSSKRLHLPYSHRCFSQKCPKLRRPFAPEPMTFYKRSWISSFWLHISAKDQAVRMQLNAWVPLPASLKSHERRFLTTKIWSRPLSLQSICPKPRWWPSFIWSSRSQKFWLAQIKQCQCLSVKTCRSSLKLPISLWNLAK